MPIPGPDGDKPQEQTKRKPASEEELNFDVSDSQADSDASDAGSDQDSDQKLAAESEVDFSQFKEILRQANEISMGQPLESDNAGDKALERSDPFDSSQKELRTRVDQGRGSIRHSIDFGEQLGGKVAEVLTAPAEDDRTRLHGEATTLNSTLESLDGPRQMYANDLTGTRVEHGLLLISTGDDSKIALGEKQLASLVRDQPELLLDREFKRQIQEAYADMTRNRTSGDASAKGWTSPLKSSDILPDQKYFGADIEAADSDESRLSLKSELEDAFQLYDQGGIKDSEGSFEGVIGKAEGLHHRNLSRVVDGFIEGLRKSASDEPLGTETDPWSGMESDVEEAIKSREFLVPASATLALLRIGSGEESSFKPGKLKLLEHLDRNPELALSEPFEKAWLAAFRDHALAGREPGDSAPVSENGNGGVTSDNLSWLLSQDSRLNASQMHALVKDAVVGGPQADAVMGNAEEVEVVAQAPEIAESTETPESRAEEAVQPEVDEEAAIRKRLLDVFVNKDDGSTKKPEEIVEALEKAVEPSEDARVETSNETIALPALDKIAGIDNLDIPEIDDRIEFEPDLWHRIKENPLVTALVAYGGYQVLKQGRKFVLARKAAAESGSETGDNSGEKLGESKSSRETELKAGSEVTIEGERARVSQVLADGRVVTRLPERHTSATAEFADAVPEGYVRIDSGEVAQASDSKVEYYMRKPVDETSVLPEGDYDFLKVSTTDDGSLAIQEANEEFEIVEREKLGPSKQEYDALQRSKTLSALELKASEQVRVPGGWGRFAGTTSDNKVIVELAGEIEAATGISAPSEADLAESGYEKLKLDLSPRGTESGEGREFFYRPAADPTDIHSQDELAVVEEGMISSSERFMIVDPADLDPIREVAEGTGEVSRSMERADISTSHYGREFNREGLELSMRQYSDGVSIGVPFRNSETRGYNEPRDLRVYSADGGKTNITFFRDGPWFHFADGKHGEGSSKVHVNAIGSKDSAAVGRVLYPVVADALSDNPQTEMGRRLKELNLLGAKIQDPLNRDPRYSDESVDREIKHIVKDGSTGEESYRDVHPGPKGQSTKNLVLYTRDTESARQLARVVDEYLHTHLEASPELFLDPAHETGQVSDGRRLSGTNRVSVSRDAWPLADIPEGDYKDAVYPNIISIGMDDGTAKSGRTAVGALLEDEVGELIRERVKEVYGNSGELQQSDLDRLSEEVGIRKGVLTLDNQNRIAAHAQMMDLSRGDVAYMSDGEASEGDLTGRRALYSLYEFLHGDSEGKDPAYHQQVREQLRAADASASELGTVDGISFLESKDSPRADLVSLMNDRLKAMAETDFSKLEGAKFGEFLHDFETSVQKLERLYKEELLEAKSELDPGRSHRKAQVLTEELSQSAERAKLIVEGISGLTEAEGRFDADSTAEILRRLEGLKEPIHSFGRTFLTEAFLLENRAKTMHGDRSYISSSLISNDALEKFATIFNEPALSSRIEPGSSNVEAGRQASLLLHKFLRKSEYSSMMEGGLAVEFSEKVSTPQLSFTDRQSGRPVKIVSFDGVDGIDSTGLRHPYVDLKASIQLPESYKEERLERAPRAVVEQLTRLRARVDGALVPPGRSVENELSSEGGERKLLQTEAEIVRAAFDRFEDRSRLVAEERSNLAAVERAVLRELTRQGLPEFYATENLAELTSFPGRSTRGEFSSGDYKIRVLKEAQNRTSIATHEAEHLARAQRLATLSVAYPSEFREMVLDSCLAGCGRGGLIRGLGADKVEYRKDFSSSAGREQMKDLVREYVRESKLSAGDLRGTSVEDVSKWLAERTNEQGLIEGASRLQVEYGGINGGAGAGSNDGMTAEAIAATIKSEVVHYAITSHEAGLNLEPSRAVKERALAFQQAMKQVGKGGSRLSGESHMEYLSPLRQRESVSEMRGLIGKYLADSGMSTQDLKNLDVLDVQDWLQGRVDGDGRLPDGATLQGELGSLDNVARHMQAELSGFARSASAGSRRSNQDLDHRFKMMVVEQSLVGVGEGEPRFTREGAESRPTYKNRSSAQQMTVMVYQFLSSSDKSMFELQNLSAEEVHSWMTGAEAGQEGAKRLPGALMSEFGNDTMRVAEEIKAELVHTAFNHYELVMPHSQVPEPVFRHILDSARALQGRVEHQKAVGELDSVKDLPEARKLTVSISLDSVGRVHDPAYVHSRTEVSARRVQLRDQLREEIWKSVKSEAVRRVIYEEGMKSPVVQRMLPADGKMTRPLARAILEEGMKSPLVKQAIIREGSKSDASRELIDAIRLDVKREQLDLALAELERDPANSENRSKARELAAHIARDLSKRPYLDKSGEDSLRFLVEMDLLPENHPILKDRELGRTAVPTDYLAGTVGYDNQPEVDFGRLKEAESQIRSELLAITSNRSRLNSDQTTETLNRAADATVRFITDPSLRIAEHLGLPVEFIDRENFKYTVDDAVQGKYKIGTGESYVGVNSENHMVTATHELGHEARWLELMALGEKDPLGVRLAIMDNVIAGAGKPGRIAVDSRVLERVPIKSHDAREAFKGHVKERILSELEAAGFDVAKEKAELPPRIERPGFEFEPSLLAEFGNSEVAVEEAIKAETESYLRSVKLLDTTELNNTSLKVVDSIKYGRAGEVIRLAMHNLVEAEGGVEVSAETHLAQIKQEVARLTAREPGDLSTGMSVSDELVRQVAGDLPVDLQARQLRLAIDSVVDNSNRELVSHVLATAEGEADLATVSSRLKEMGASVPDAVIEEVLGSSQKNHEALAPYEIREHVASSKGEVPTRSLVRQLAREFNVDPDSIGEAEMKKAVIASRNNIHERMLERMNNVAEGYQKRPPGSDELKAPEISGRDNALVRKHVRTFSLDAVARESGQTSQLSYAISSDETAARKGEVALRAKEIHRELRGLPAGDDRVETLRRDHEKLVDYLKNTSTFQRLHRAIMENDTKTATALARSLVEPLSTNVDYNRPIMEWMLENSLLERGDLAGTAYEGFFTPDGRARSLVLERMRKFSSYSPTNVTTVKEGESGVLTRFREPLEVRDLRGNPVKVDAIRVDGDGRVSLTQVSSTGRESNLPLDRVYSGNYTRDFIENNQTSGGRTFTEMAGNFADYLVTLAKEQEAGTEYKSLTESRLSAKNAANQNFRMYVEPEANALRKHVWESERPAQQERWKENRLSAEAALLEPAREAAAKLGLPPELIAPHNIVVEILREAAGTYGDGMIKIGLNADDPVNVIEHEVKHFQESLDRTALKMANPELFSRLVLEDCLGHIGQGGKRLSFNQVSGRPKYESPEAVDAMRGLVRDYIAEKGRSSDRKEISEFLESRELSPELLSELRSNRGVIREMEAEIKHYNATLSNSVISDVLVKTAGDGVLNQAAKEYLERRAAEFKATQAELASSGGDLSSAPDVRKLMTGIASDAVGRVDKSFYQFSIEEIRARRFEKTRQLSRLVDRGESREALEARFPMVKFIMNDIALGNAQEAVLVELKRMEAGDPQGKHLEAARGHAQKVMELLPEGFTSSDEAVRFMLERNLISQEIAAAAGYDRVVTAVAVHRNLIEPDNLAEKHYREAHYDAFVHTFEKLEQGQLPESGKLKSPVEVKGGGRYHELERPIEAYWDSKNIVEIQGITETADGSTSVKLKFKDGKVFDYPLNDRNTLYSKFDYMMKTKYGRALSDQQRMDLLVDHWETLERVTELSDGPESTSGDMDSRLESRSDSQVREPVSSERELARVSERYLELSRGTADRSMREALVRGLDWIGKNPDADITGGDGARLLREAMVGESGPGDYALEKAIETVGQIKEKGIEAFVEAVRADEIKAHAEVFQATLLQELGREGVDLKFLDMNDAYVRDSVIAGLRESKQANLRVMFSLLDSPDHPLHEAARQALSGTLGTVEPVDLKSGERLASGELSRSSGGRRLTGGSIADTVSNERQRVERSAPVKVALEEFVREDKFAEKLGRELGIEDMEKARELAGKLLSFDEAEQRQGRMEYDRLVEKTGARAAGVRANMAEFVRRRGAVVLVLSAAIPTINYLLHQDDTTDYSPASWVGN